MNNQFDQKQNDTRQVRRWLSVKNVSGEDIPAFAVMQIVGIDAGGEYQVAKPRANGAAPCLINGPGKIFTDKYGRATKDYPCEVLYNAAAGVPANGDTWGPAANSWKIDKGFGGFIIVGGAEDVPGTVQVMECCEPEEEECHCAGGGGTGTGTGGNCLKCADLDPSRRWTDSAGKVWWVDDPIKGTTVVWCSDLNGGVPPPASGPAAGTSPWGWTCFGLDGKPAPCCWIPSGNGCSWYLGACSTGGGSIGGGSTGGGGFAGGGGGGGTGGGGYCCSQWSQDSSGWCGCSVWSPRSSGKCVPQPAGCTNGYPPPPTPPMPPDKLWGEVFVDGILMPPYGGTGVTDPGASGNVLTSDGAGGWTSSAPAAAGLSGTTVKKTSDESKTSDTTLAADAALSFSMAANTKYGITIVILFDTGSPGGDFKFDLSGPASPTAVRWSWHACPPAMINSMDSQGSGYITSTALLGGGSGGFLRIELIVQNGGTAGTFSFRWAQNTSDAAATKVMAGSRLDYTTF